MALSSRPDISGGVAARRAFRVLERDRHSAGTYTSLSFFSLKSLRVNVYGQRVSSVDAVPHRLARGARGFHGLACERTKLRNYLRL